jgi:dihydrolipoamide dehydrogenase
MANYDLIVIGAGPAGYEAAIRAAQLGKKVACVDKDRNGGTCNNWGCIPTKALLKNAELYHDMKDRAAEFGFEFDGLRFNWSKIIKRSRDVSQKGTAGVDYLFRKNKIDSLRGEASLEKADQVKVQLAEGGEQTHAAANILFATGCVSRPRPGLQFNDKTVIGSKEAVVLEQLPKSIVIKGFIKVNDRYETTVAGIYAAGDIIGPPWLAHVASFEAIQTVEGAVSPRLMEWV